MMSEVRPTSVPSSSFSSQVSGLKGRRAFLAALAAVLVLAIGLIVYGENRPLERKFHGSVKDLLPKPEEIPGWTVQYLPIADTPEMQAKVNEVLNYDDGVFAVYAKGSMRISVYIAYWAPGRMPTKEIARHTPDVCWVNAGWKRTMWESIPELNIRNGGPTIKHTEHRTFVAGGDTQHVAFWHLVDDTVYSYGTGARPPWYAVIADTLRWGVKQRQEQFFIRISSQRSLYEVLETDLGSRIVQRTLTRGNT